MASKAKQKTMNFNAIILFIIRIIYNVLYNQREIVRHSVISHIRENSGGCLPRQSVTLDVSINASCQNSVSQIQGRKNIARVLHGIIVNIYV